MTEKTDSLTALRKLFASEEVAFDLDVSINTQDPVIGLRLKQLRQEASLSLRELATRLGISASALSQIENGKMQPSVNRLISIVSALDVPLSAAFVDKTRDVHPVKARAQGDLPVGTMTDVAVARKHEVAPIRLSSGVYYERLSPVQISGAEWFKSTYPPEATTSPGGEFLTHEGFEVGHMVSGKLNVEYEDATVELSEGDSLSHPASRPHRIVNPSETESAVILWLTLHDSNLS